MCVNIVHKRSNLQFKVDYKRLIFGDTFITNLFILRVFARNRLRGSHQRNFFFIFSFWCLTWDTNPAFASTNPTHYLLDYGDFNTTGKRNDFKLLLGFYLPSGMALCLILVIWSHQNLSYSCASSSVHLTFLVKELDLIQHNKICIC